MNNILQDIKVIDLTSVVMGPYCTLLLADMGADVIKVESEAGDSTRYLGPSRTEGMGSIFLHLNRNKRSVVLDLKSEEGKGKMISLIREADVFVHSLRNKSIERLGLSYKELSKENKKLIYCAMYGYSKHGSYSEHPAYDDIIQAASGVAATQGKMTGRPQYLSALVADKTAGLFGAYAIMAALYHRQRTGIGQEIEVPMFETLVAYNMIEHMYGQTFDPPLGDVYYSRAVSPYRKPYRTKDGYIAILIYNDKHWENFFEITKRYDLKNDSRFMDIHTRTKHIDFVYKTVESIIAEKTTKEWIKILEKADIPFTEVNSPADLLTNQHLVETKFFNKRKHPTEGQIIDLKFPVNFSETPANYRRHAPKLGEHNDEIFNSKLVK